MRLVSLPCVFALLATPALAQVRYKLFASDSVSVTRVGTPPTFQDNRLRAYNNPTATVQKVNGLFKFDLRPLPPAAIVSATLTLYMENAFSSPRGGPVVNLHYSADDTWTRATATPTSGALGPVVTPNVATFTHPKHSFAIDLTKQNLFLDLATPTDKTLTFAIDNVNTAYSYIYFFGHTGSPAGPNAELEIVLAGTCLGSAAAYGAGGQDSTAFTTAMQWGGCPDLGRTFYLGASIGPVSAIKPIILAVGASNTTWLTLPLPFHLAPLGGSGNYVNASLDVLLGTVPHTGAGGQVGLPIANDQALANLKLYFQCLVLDAAANKLGIVTTNGLAVTLR